MPSLSTSGGHVSNINFAWYGTVQENLTLYHTRQNNNYMSFSTTVRFSSWDL